MWSVNVATGGNDKDKSVRLAGTFSTKREAYAEVLRQRGPDHSAILRAGHAYTVRAPLR